LRSLTDGKWFIPAMIFLALCLYAYGTAYVPCPVPVMCAAGLLGVKKIGCQTSARPGCVRACLRADRVIFAGQCPALGFHLLGPITIPQVPVRLGTRL